MDDILDAISFSRYSGNERVDLLTPSEIICCHQHLRLRKKLAERIKYKLYIIKVEIGRLKWQRPIMRYNHQYQQEFWNGDDWKVFKQVLTKKKINNYE